MNLKAAVIGVGIMGQNHARVYSQIAHLVAVVDTDLQKAQAVTGLYGGRFYVDYLEMLNQEQPDLVSLAVPTGLHHQLALGVISLGVPLLVEKPITAVVWEAEEIVEAAEKQKVLLTVGHIERFNPAVQELKRRIDGGELGNITSIVAKRVGPLPPRMKDVDVVTDLAVHDIDIVCYLLGGAPVDVYASGGHALLSDRIDHAEIFLRYKGVGCFVQVNWITPVKIRTLSVTGDDGYAELDYLTQQLTVYKNDAGDSGDFPIQLRMPRKTIIPIVWREPLELELSAFCNAVQGRASIKVTGAEGIQALQVAKWALDRIREPTKSSA